MDKGMRARFADRLVPDTYRRDEPAYYLFDCDEEWNSITDTRHETIEEALQQAESEYAGVSATWNVV
jgi:hypothetical protein